VIIVRLFNTVGPRQTGRYGMVIPRFVEQALHDEPLTIHGDGKQTRCFAFVGDVVPALIALMDRHDLCGDVYNIGSRESVTIEELARRVIERAASRSTLSYIPYENAYGPGYEDMLHREPSLDKIAKAIGYAPAATLDTILDIVIAERRKRTKE
jgi:UDP-glucose 4-epimerase